MKSVARPERRRRGCLLLVLLCATGLAQGETLLVVRKSDHALDFIDPGSGLTLASVPTGASPHEIAVSPDGRQALVTNYGSREQPGASLSLIDLEHPRELRRIQLDAGTRPHGLHWYAPARAAVTAEGSGQLLIVDPLAGRIVQSIATGQEVSHMVAVSADGARAFVANIGSGSTSVIDLAAGRKLADVPTGRGSEGLAITRDGREVWVAAREEGRVQIFDAATLQPLASVEVPGTPIRVLATADGARMLITSATSSELSVVDVATRAVVQRRALAAPVSAVARARPAAQLAPGGALPVGVAASPDLRAIYVAATMADAVLVLDPVSMNELRRIDVSGEPDGLGLSELQPKAVCHACEAPR